MITTKDIENLAQLSRIKLTDAEKGSLLKEIDSILAYVDQIKTAGDVSVDGDVNRIGAVKNVARSDSVKNTSDTDRDNILNEAPDREGDFVAVKKIIGG